MECRRHYIDFDNAHAGSRLARTSDNVARLLVDIGNEDLSIDRQGQRVAELLPRMAWKQTNHLHTVAAEYPCYLRLLSTGRNRMVPARAQGPSRLLKARMQSSERLVLMGLTWLAEPAAACDVRPS